MQAKAPTWGKAVGIIMICLGGLGTFYQLYKIIFPSFFSQVPFNNVGNSEFKEIFGLGSSGLNMMIIFGFIGILLSVFYIIGGAKRLTAKPANYYFAKYTLLIFIIYNLIGVVLFYLLTVGFFIRILLIYAVVGLVFDIALFVIALSSNKAAYGIGGEQGIKQVYTNDRIDEEII